MLNFQIYELFSVIFVQCFVKFYYNENNIISNWISYLNLKFSNIDMIYMMHILYLWKMIKFCIFSLYILAT